MRQKDACRCLRDNPPGLQTRIVTDHTACCRPMSLMECQYSSAILRTRLRHISMRQWCGAGLNLRLEMCFEKLGDGGVAGDAILIREHIMTLILEDQIVHLLAGCLKLLNHIPRLALFDTRVVLALNHQQRASDRKMQITNHQRCSTTNARD